MHAQPEGLVGDMNIDEGDSRNQLLWKEW